MHYEQVYHTERLCNHKHHITNKQDLRHIFSHPITPSTNFCFHCRDYTHSSRVVNCGWKDVRLNDTRFEYNLQISSMVFSEYSDHYLLLIVLILNIDNAAQIEEVWNEYCYHNTMPYEILKWVNSTVKNIKYNKRKREYWRKNVRLLSLRLRYTRKPMLIQIKTYLGEQAHRLMTVVTERMQDALKTVSGLRFHLLGTKLRPYFE